MSCVICTSNDYYDHRLNSHYDSIGVYLDAERMRLIVNIDAEDKTDMPVFFCPMCGRDLRKRVDE
jgi:hypothetical protein